MSRVAPYRLLRYNRQSGRENMAAQLSIRCSFTTRIVHRGVCGMGRGTRIVHRGVCGMGRGTRIVHPDLEVKFSRLTDLSIYNVL